MDSAGGSSEAGADYLWFTGNSSWQMKCIMHLSEETDVEIKSTTVLEHCTDKATAKSSRLHNKLGKCSTIFLFVLLSLEIIEPVSI